MTLAKVSSSFVGEESGSTSSLSSKVIKNSNENKKDKTASHESMGQQKLLKELHAIQKQTDAVRKSQNVKLQDQINSMKLLDSFTRDAGFNNTVVMKVDAEALAGVSGLSNGFARNLLKGSKRMSLTTFGTKFMGLHLQGGDSRYAAIGKKYANLQFAIPINRYLLGAVEPPPRANRQINPRQARDAGTAMTKIMMINEKSGGEGDTTRKRKRNNEIIRAVKQQATDSSRSDTDFFKTVVNPKSFTQTVENIFASSFCVKETTLSLKSRNGIPYAQAMVDDSQNADGSTEEHQSILTFNKDTINKLVDLYNLEESVIEHRTGDHYTASQ